MKLKIVFISITCAAALLLSSCGASKSCPAYGKAETEQQEDIRS